MLTSEQRAFSVEMFPNPITEYSVLKINNDLEGNLKVQIISINGTVQKELNLYKEKGLMQTKLQTGGLSPGSYIIKLSMDGWNDAKQLIKQ
jgi:hypothetical protein